VTMAAPVGVTSSALRQGVGRIGAPALAMSSSVAGAGTGMVPCAHSATPLPEGRGDEYRVSISSSSSPMTVPTTSTIASTAPTSWNRTLSTGTRWTFASASARRLKTAALRSFALCDKSLLSMMPIISLRLRCARCLSITIVTLVPLMTPRFADVALILYPFRFSLRSSRLSRSTGRPQPTSAPSSMSPLTPETQSRYAIFRIPSEHRPARLYCLTVCRW